MENQVFAHICLGIVDLQIAKENGAVIRKSITLDDFIRTISATARAKGVSLGALPTGYYNAKIVSLEDMSFSCSLVMKGRCFLANYFEEQYQIPYPDLFFWFNVEEGKVTKSRCFALKSDKNISDSTELYYFPFANVHEDGRICWGDNTLPIISSMQELDGLVALFYGAPYNNDLFDSTQHLVGKGGISLFEFFNELKKKKSFPKEVLKRTSLHVSDIAG